MTKLSPQAAFSAWFNFPVILNSCSLQCCVGFVQLFFFKCVEERKLINLISIMSFFQLVSSVS